MTRVALAALAALLSVGVGVSRVYFGVHFPTDVLGGWIASAIWLVVVILVVQALEWHAARASRSASVERGA